MTTERQSLEHDAVLMVHQRNLFYKRKYHLILGVCVLGILMIITLAGMAIYIYKHPPYPLYFVTDTGGRFIQDIPVQSPNMSTQDVAAWVTEAVEAAFSYDYVNYHVQLQAAEKYFTDYGWKRYNDALEASNNLVALAKRKQIVLAKVVNPPELVQEGPLGKAAIYAWKFKMPVLITYLMPPYDDVAGQSRTQNALTVTVLVSRQSVLVSENGLGIVQLISEMA